MAKIYRYRKESDDYTTYNAQGSDVVELCTLEDGYTYISGPDDLPPQPNQITVEPVTITPELREQIKASSPHCRLINQRMQEQIRAKYSAEDEMYLTRIAVGVLQGAYVFEPGESDLVTEYQTFVEDVRAWGRVERAKIGL
jgi:hypothetical protein